MEALKMFSIPIKGLGIGRHAYDYRVGKEFFSNFDASEINIADIMVKVDLDKQIRMMEFVFSFDGTFRASCDRCLSNIDIDISGSNKLLVKMENSEQQNNEDVVYIEDTEDVFNIAPYIYEFIHLAKPLQNIRDCESEDFELCDEEVLNKLDTTLAEENVSNPLWDQLKDINLE